MLQEKLGINHRTFQNIKILHNFENEVASIKRSTDMYPGRVPNNEDKIN